MPISRSASICSVSGNMSISMGSGLTLSALGSKVKNLNSFERLMMEYAEWVSQSSTTSFSVRSADDIWGDTRTSGKWGILFLCKYERGKDTCNKTFVICSKKNSNFLISPADNWKIQIPASKHEARSVTTLMSTKESKIHR